MWRTRRRFCDLTLALALAGCGAVPSSDPHAGMQSLAPPSGAYRLWYLAPPWEVVENRPGHAVLRVPTSGDPIVAGGTAGAVIGLVIDEVPGSDPLAWVAARVTAETATGATVSRPAVLARSTGAPLADGAVATYDGSTRYAAMAVPGAGLVTLVFTAPTALGDDPDVTQMVALLAAGGAP